MIVKIEIQKQSASDPEIEEEKKCRLLRKIYREFPEALWEKYGKRGFEVLI